MSMNLTSTPRVRRVATMLGAVAIVWSCLPLAWMLLTAFKPASSIMTSTPKLLFTPSLINFRHIFVENSIAPYILHSIVASLGSTLLALALGVMAGYGLFHWRAKFKRHLSFWIISTRMAPIAAVIVPLFVMFRQVGLINSLWGLIVAYLTFNLPFSIWLMNAFFAQVPVSLEEAAQIDGCTPFRSFLTVALPVAKPGIVATGVLCMVFSWNDYAFAASFSGPASQTLPMSAGALITQTGIDWGQLCAIGIVTVVPMVVLGLAVRRHLATGMAMGAVTGE